jgi:hypothetical protein
MGHWASQNGVKVQMFEAIDEPWKNDEINGDPNNPGGRFGAEGHYGWWKRTSNSDPNSYVDKTRWRCEDHDMWLDDLNLEYLL